jgi:hypothetical protein
MLRVTVSLNVPPLSLRETFYCEGDEAAYPLLAYLRENGGRLVSLETVKPMTGEQMVEKLRAIVKNPSV